MKLSRLAFLLVMSVLTCAARDARAHSFPREQHPSAGQTLSVAPAEVRIKFDAPIEKLFAKLQVFDEDGKDHVTGALELSSDGIELIAKLDALKPGEYTVRWSVIGLDTHHTEGSYSFVVRIGGA